MMPAGLKSKFSLIATINFSSETFPVSNVSTEIETGSATPIAYAIGVAEPVSISVDTFDTGKVSEEKLIVAIRENFDLRPAGIIRMIDLRSPIYKQTASYGHFGRTDIDLPWERTDKAEAIQTTLKLIK